MTPRQRQAFITGLGRNSIPYKEHHGGEISMLCPRCGPAHEKPRQTLSINSNNDRWQCWRCSELKGRKAQIGLLLDILRLQYLLPMFEQDEVVVEDNSLAKLRHKLLFGEQKIVKTLSQTKLPDEYRTDWDATIVGKNLLNYLTRTRKLTLQQILKYKIGYAVTGNYAGGVILPVYMEKKLRFWQVRRVMFVGNREKYDSPSIERADVLFGYDSITAKHANIVEGIFDAIALGEETVALLSKEIREEQIALLAEKQVESINVVLDGEAWRESQKVARTIANKMLSVRTVTAIRLKFGQDPGKLGKAALENPIETLKLRS